MAQHQPKFKRPAQQKPVQLKLLSSTDADGDFLRGHRRRCLEGASAPSAPRPHWDSARPTQLVLKLDVEPLNAVAPSQIRPAFTDASLNTGAHHVG